MVLLMRWIIRLLRSSLVSRHKTSKGESWKARASEPKGSVQARADGIPPWSGLGGGDKAETHCPRPERLAPRSFLRMLYPGLAECLIKEPYELVVSRGPLVCRYYMDPARKLFPKTPFHILARHQTVLSSIDFLGVAGKEKIDEKPGCMGVSGIFREPDAARVLDEQGSGIA